MPEGIYISDDEKMYICDTENGCVEICNCQGDFIGKITTPKSDLLPKNFKFEPVRVVVDSKGYIYVLSKGCYYGALLFTPDLEFCSFYGANETKGTLLGALEKIKNSIFSNNEKQSASLRKLPYQFSDFEILDDFVYTVTRLVEVNGYNNSTGQLRKLNPGGSNILTVSENGEHISASSYKFQDEGCFRGVDETTLAVGNKESDFVGISVDDYGYIYALDMCYGKIFVYDSECNFLNVFGGGYGEGSQKGVFKEPTAISVCGKNIFITDKKNASITVFERNAFGDMVFEAQNLTLGGNYSKGSELWKSVIKQDRAYQLAYEGLSKYAYSKGDYESAKEFAEKGHSQHLYSKAQKKLQSKFFTENFYWLFPSILILVFLLFIFFRYFKHSNILINYKFANILNAVVHPFDTFDAIRYSDGGSIIISTFLIVLYPVTAILSDIISGFAFHIFDATEYNSFFTLGSTAGLVVLWIFVSWLVCSLLNGKGNLKQIFIANGYCMTPLVVLNILKCILTNTLLPSQQTAITVLSVLLTGYSLFMICIASMKVHEYNFFEFLGTAAISVFGMILIVFIIFLIFMLGQEAVSFVTTIFKEVTTR